MSLNVPHPHLADQLEKLQTIYDLSDAVVRAKSTEEIYEIALDGLQRTLRINRASILLFDADGVMRFKAWRGLSDDYRRAVEGHSPWSRNEGNPAPILAPDVKSDAVLASYSETFRKENIGALAFIPLVFEGNLLGKFMLYYDELHSFTEEEIQLVQTIASHVAFSIGRRQVAERLNERELERERLLLAEQTARKEAEAANRAKDDFLATVSHELRTPLNAMLGWVRLLEAGSLDPAMQRKALETIERNIKAQANLIEDLLDMSRIIAGKLSMESRETDLRRVVEASVDVIRQAAESKKLNLSLILAAEPQSVMGDATRLQQVVWNLLSNAVKFTPPHGTVEVRVESVDHSAKIIVRDTGKGISRDFLPHIFDRFRQADSSISRSHSGLGLGLAIVRHLIKLHGGTVSASSEGEGRGSTFIVSIPRIESQNEPAESEKQVLESVPLKGRLLNLKVLVVDDDTDNRELVGAVLAGSGAQVRMCKSSADALNLAPQWWPQVVVSDIGMPEEDGYVFLQKMKDLAGKMNRQFFAIALTAYARSDDRARALNAGFSKYVCKPIEPEQLVSTVAEFL